MGDGNYINEKESAQKESHHQKRTRRKSGEKRVANIQEHSATLFPRFIKIDFGIFAFFVRISFVSLYLLLIPMQVLISFFAQLVLIAIIFFHLLIRAWNKRKELKN